MTGRVIRFPDRVRAAVLLLAENDGGGWLVLVGEHGWLHGNRDEAVRSARWHAANRGWPLREMAA